MLKDNSNKDNITKINSITTKIIGCGSYSPEKVLTNDDLSLLVDTSDEWIFTRTGIRSRHVASDTEKTSDLAFFALKSAIEMAQISPMEIDCIILATTTPDIFMPATAIRVQELIGAKNAAAFDIQAVCSGFTYGISIANSMIVSGSAFTVAVIGAEIMSKIVDWNDRSTCVLFGDGAGAFILRSNNFQEEESQDNKSSFPETESKILKLEDKISGIEDTKIISYSELQDALYIPGGITTGNLEAKIHMSGSEVFRHAVEKMTKLAIETLEKNNYSVHDIDWILPHQANIRILQAIANKMNISIDKFMTSIEHHANTSAASIPITFNEYVKKGLIQKGQLIMMISAGAGMTFGAVLFRF